MPFLLFRKPSPLDRKSSQYTRGELLRFVPGTDELEGFTTVTVQSSLTVRYLENDGTGWKLHGELHPAPVAPAVAPGPAPWQGPGKPPATPAAPAPDPRLAVLAGDLASLETLLDSKEMTAEWVNALEAGELAKPKPRKGAAALFAAWRTAHPADATLVLPADPKAPLNPNLGPGQGGDVKGAEAAPRGPPLVDGAAGGGKGKAGKGGAT